ncbi:hypothetical protein [Sphingobacterium yanglingense]|uniref:Uncharacterized protein n=1 Tax=Sphingobacterium yanglingense TaxID=1437280 RepID=A0A4R6WR04_9SPHI|nr:hypothetical protein [Sphingobacterium yanglingense]TDQ79056.1 hypothetical protein CLV99_0487 [Sphingobacterium yanglingense]
MRHLNIGTGTHQGIAICQYQDYELLDCNGFSAQWLYLSKEMVQQGVHKSFLDQTMQQLDYKTKTTIKFWSQNQPFKGIRFEMKDGTFRIIGFGEVTGVPLILNLKFAREPKDNDSFSVFEKNFIELK